MVILLLSLYGAPHLSDVKLFTSVLEKTTVAEKGAFSAAAVFICPVPSCCPPVHFVSLWGVTVLLHGFYDSCCMIGTGQSTMVFVAFVAAMYFIVFRLIKHESRVDRPV